MRSQKAQEKVRVDVESRYSVGVPGEGMVERIEGVRAEGGIVGVR